MALTPFTRLSNLLAFRRDPIGQMLLALRPAPVVSLDLGPFDVVAVADASAIHRILQNPDQFDKVTRAQRMIRRLLGNGLLTSSGEAWRTRRRIAQPAFRRPKLEAYAQIMHDVSDRVAHDWRTAEGPIDVQRSMLHLALEVATRCLFDDDLAGEADILDRALRTTFASFQRMVTQPLARPEVLLVGPAATYRKSIGAIEQVVDRLIARRRARGSDGDDLLHRWLHSGLDDRAIRDEVLTMLLAAHETTANTLSWAWLHLLRHPAALRSLREEVAGLGTPQAILEASLQPGALPFTDAVVAEALRLYPPAWVTSRGVTAPTTFDVAGQPPCYVRQGTVLVLCFYVMQRDPRTWAHPEGFDPERWLRSPAEGGVRGRTFPDLPYAPFGAGQRKCIGSHFALLEARIALATLVPRVDVALRPGPPIGAAAGITLRPDRPIWATG